MKKSFFRVNERLFASKEVGGMGNVNFLRGKFVRGINILGRCLSYSSTRSYGCFLLSFGIMSLLLGLGEYYFYSQSQVASTSLLISLAIALVAIPLLVFDKPMCIAVQDFPVTDRIFF